MKRVLIALIGGYKRWLSPWLPPMCRFQPTCSTYAIAALQRHGTLKGSWLAVRRILRCHPGHPGGYDPVPPVLWTVDQTDMAELIRPSTESPEAEEEASLEN